MAPLQAPRDKRSSRVKRRFTATRHEDALMFERIMDVFNSNGIDSRHTFALMAEDNTGTVQVHISGAVKGHLNPFNLVSEFRNATEKAEAALCEFATPSSRGSVSGRAVSFDDKLDSFPGLPVKQAHKDMTSSSSPSYSSWTSHRRRRSATPQRVSRFPSAQPETRIPVPVQGHDAVDGPLTPVAARQPITFCIGDDTKVVAFLHSRLKRMQQLADKKIAKAWIKGICPKKQAKFPYHNRRQEEMTGQPPQVPCWWPDTETECPFTEPDHIKRHERIKLCIHLLRLRPSPSAWKQMNGEPFDPDTIPELWPQGWTGLLEEFAGEDIFNGLQKESSERTEQRRQLLREMYRVARLEEKMLNGEIDKTDTFTYYEDEQEMKLLPSKRSHAVTSMANTGTDSRESSVAASFHQQKRRRLDSAPETPALFQPPTPGYNMEMAGAEEPDNILTPGDDTFRNVIDDESRRTPAIGQDNMNTFAGECEVVPLKNESTRRMNGPCAGSHWDAPGQWTDSSSSFHRSTTLDCSTISSFESKPHPYPMETSSFPDRHNYDFPLGQQPSNMVQSCQTAQIPEPHFQQMPMDPLLSPSSLASIPQSDFIPLRHDISHDPGFTNVNEGSHHQYYMSLQQPLGIEQFHPPMVMPQHLYHEHQSFAAQENLPSTHSHGLPYTQNDAWHQ